MISDIPFPATRQIFGGVALKAKAHTGRSSYQRRLLPTIGLSHVLVRDALTTSTVDYYEPMLVCGDLIH